MNHDLTGHIALPRNRLLPSLFIVAALCTQAPAHPAPALAKEPAGRLVTVAGHKIWVHRFGKGAPLLFIPGGPGAAHHFWPDMNVFADSFTVIYYDPFGRGASDRATDAAEYTFTHDVDEIEGLRVALGLGKLNVYGKSYGTMVAQAYALKYPDSVSHLILAAAFHSAEMWQKANNDNANDQIRKQYPELWQQLEALRNQGAVSTDPAYMAVTAKVDSSLLYYYDPSNNADNFDINFDVYKQLAGANADVIVGGDLAHLDFRARLHEIKAPTLVIAGRFDRVSTPEYAVQYKTWMPQARFVVFEKSGHHPSIEEPQLHARVVRAFLADKP